MSIMMTAKTDLTTNFAEQMTRLRAVIGLRTQPELAAYFGVELAAVKDVMQSNKIPAEWLLILLRVKQVSPEWVLTGQEPCFLGTGPGQYETGEATAERWIREEALQRLPSRVLADELVRRIAVAEAKAAAGPVGEAD